MMCSSSIDADRPPQPWERIRDQINKEFECDCSTKQVVYWLANGHQIYGRQCLNCGKNGSVPTSSVRWDERSSAIPLDKSISQRHWERRSQRSQGGQSTTPRAARTRCAATANQARSIGVASGTIGRVYRDRS
jgi:hypothetical protein